MSPTDIALAAAGALVVLVVYLTLRPKRRTAHVPEEFFPRSATVEDDLDWEDVERAPRPDSTEPESQPSAATVSATAAIDDDDTTAEATTADARTDAATPDEPPADATAEHADSDDGAATAVACVDGDAGAAPDTTDDDGNWGFWTMFGVTDEKASELRRRIEAELANTGGHERMIASLEAELAAATGTAATATPGPEEQVVDEQAVEDPATNGRTTAEAEAGSTEAALRQAISLLHSAAKDAAADTPAASDAETDALAAAFTKLAQHRTT